MGYDINKIKEDFLDILTETQEVDCELSVDQVFEDWQKNKCAFLNNPCFENLIYEVPETVHFQLDGNSCNHHFTQFIDWLWFHGRYESYNINSEMTSLDAAVEFLRSNKDSFFNNTVTVAYPNIPEIKIGMNITKALKFFFSNENQLKTIQDRMSVAIQMNKIEGKLCFSIHPLDYLTVSVNNHNWRSCHALDGEYRAGNLSYMTDKHTIVCYLKSSENERLPGCPSYVPWNSKKWRVLLYIDPNTGITFAGRQYPIASIEGLNTLLPHLVKILSVYNRNWTSGSLKWKQNYINSLLPDESLWAKYLEIYHVIRDLNHVINDCKQGLHYNDLLRSSVYDYPYYLEPSWIQLPSSLSQFATEIHPLMTIGNEVKCLHCGKNYIEAGENTMLCPECELRYGTVDNDSYGHCDYCGARHYYDDLIYVEYGDVTLCPSCFERHAVRCDRCDRYMLTEEAHYDESRNEYYCADCWEEIDEED